MLSAFTIRNFSTHSRGPHLVLDSLSSAPFRLSRCSIRCDRKRNASRRRNYHIVAAQSRVPDPGICEPNSSGRPGRRLASLSVALFAFLNIASPSSTKAEEDDEIDKYFPPLTPEGLVLPYPEKDKEKDVQTRSGSETVTDVVYLDIGVCPEGYRTDRTLGDKSALCTSADPLGRLVIGLYGNEAPATVRNFKRVIASGAYNGTIFSKLREGFVTGGGKLILMRKWGHDVKQVDGETCQGKVLPGEYILAGRQGSKRMGEVAGLPDLPPNDDLLSPSAFRLRHNRPGTVSLSLTENDDETFIKQRPGYRNTEFLITTGPGPVPGLDGNNVVFGRVLDGLETVAAITRLPTFNPAERIQVLNKVASLIGDERAARVRAKYGRPLRSIVIVGTGFVNDSQAAGVT